MVNIGTCLWTSAKKPADSTAWEMDEDGYKTCIHSRAFLDKNWLFASWRLIPIERGYLSTSLSTGRG